MLAKEIQPFLGRWVLRPDESEYGMGEVPVWGEYVISLEGKEVVFSVAWKDQESRHFTVRLRGVPGAGARPLIGSKMSDSMELYFKGPSVLESCARKGQRMTAQVRRELIEGGAVLRLTQVLGLPGGGQSPANYSIYRLEA